MMCSASAEGKPNSSCWGTADACTGLETAERERVKSCGTSANWILFKAFCNPVENALFSQQMVNSA